MSTNTAYKQNTRAYVLLTLLLLIQFVGSYLALSFGLDEANFFTKIRVKGSEFFSQLIVNGIFLYALAVAISLLFIKFRDCLNVALTIFCLSLVVATLRAHDRFEDPPPTPDTFSGMFYSLISDRQTVLLLFVLTLLGAVALVYYMIRVFFKVSFEGSGMQIKLPGQTMYYMPIFPQDHWQNTKIQLEDGDKITVELTGLVSPGGLQNFWYLKDDLHKFHQLQQGEGSRHEWRKILDEKSWPYSGPEGYAKELYDKSSRLGVLRNHPIYGSGNGLDDDCMTIKGKPHNTVFGIIQDEKPKTAIDTFPAYDWERDKSMLYEFSDTTYPKSFNVKHTGKLWVVINDVDYARWDNTGLFFLRITKNS